ncbi:16S rRNA (cytidine(1402)-2'-O)-methyltransferase, partial [Kaarinaea lacus]
IPLPGANAAITALCASGLPSDRFCFQGFIPAKATARQKYFQALQDDARTLIFYEAPHRLLESLKDMKTVFGADRQAVLARELTKTYETIRQDSLQNLKTWVQSDIHQQKGEIVILVAGQVDVSEDTQLHSEKILDILLAELPLKQAAALAAKITGQKKNYLYQRALEKTKA